MRPETLCVGIYDLAMGRDARQWRYSPRMASRPIILDGRKCWCRRRDSNSCCRRERAVSWAGLDDGDMTLLGGWLWESAHSPSLTLTTGSFSVKELSGGVRGVLYFR